MSDNGNPHGYTRGPLARKELDPLPGPLPADKLEEPIPSDLYNEHCRCWRVYLIARTNPSEAKRVMLGNVLGMHLTPNTTVFKWPDVWEEVKWIFERPSDRLRDTIVRFNTAIKTYELWLVGDPKTVKILEEYLRVP